MTTPSKALHWLLDLLEEHKTTYQIVGGLAAIAHGATRELADIDLYIPYNSSQNFLHAIRPYTYWGPQHQKDDVWDITYLKAKYADQKIEIGDSSGAGIFNKQSNQWVLQGIDYNISERKRIHGRLADVMPKQQLIDYKTLLGREVDLQDIEQMLNVDQN